MVNGSLCEQGGDKAYAAWYNENQVLQRPKQKTKDG